MLLIIGRTALSSVDAKHNFALMVPGLQSLMSLPGLFQRKYLIEVDRDLAIVDQLRKLGQLPPIRPEVEQVRINAMCGCHLLKINNRGEPPTIAQDLHTSRGCLSTNAVQHSIDALGMSRVDSVGKICLCVINEFAGS